MMHPDFSLQKQMFKASKKFESELLTTDAAAQRRLKWTKFFIQTKFYFWRLWVASFAWIANDFAFYGNKLFQGVFISILYPKVGAAHSTFIVFVIELLAIL